MRANGGYNEPKDVFVQGPLDRRTLELIDRLGWLAEITEWLPHLCLNSLHTLRSYTDSKPAAGSAATVGSSTALSSPSLTTSIQEALHAERKRERQFYGELEDMQ